MTAALHWLGFSRPHPDDERHPLPWTPTRRLIAEFARRPEPVTGQRAISGITERERGILTLVAPAR